MKAVDWEADHYEEIPVVVVACLRWTAYGPIVSGWRPPFPPFLAAIYYGSIFSRRPEHAARRARDGTRRVADGDAALGRFARETGARAAALSRLPRLSPWGWPIGRYGPTTRVPVGDVHFVRYRNRPYRERRGLLSVAPNPSTTDFEDAPEAPRAVAGVEDVLTFAGERSFHQPSDTL